MTLSGIALSLFSISVVAGLLGALLGIGGGLIVIPALTLLYDLDIRLAIGASAVSIIATSSGAAVAYLRDRLTDVRIAVLLEVGTTAGALTGALLAGVVSPRYLYLAFGAVLLYSALAMYRSRRQELPGEVRPDALSRWLRLEGEYYDPALGRTVSYRAGRALPGLFIMYGAGIVAGLLGIGSGIFKVLAMDQVMKLPIKVSTATSNFMIGVTAAATAAVYLARGQIAPGVAAPVALGVLTGATLGTRLMVRLRGRTLRALFIPILLVTALQMFWRGWQG
ncbi:MAG: sulfite exporter TauE/SafE family protein [Firmicutes bacterium]|nr:sulfite exporter TauE/SafE family protein [Bacillota bacterium]